MHFNPMIFGRDTSKNERRCDIIFGVIGIIKNFCYKPFLRESACEEACLIDQTYTIGSKGGGFEVALCIELLDCGCESLKFGFNVYREGRV